MAGRGDGGYDMSTAEAHAAAQLPLIDLGSSPEGTLGAHRLQPCGTHVKGVARGEDAAHLKMFPEAAGRSTSERH
jgi:hypothetical protein